MTATAVIRSQHSIQDAAVQGGFSLVTAYMCEQEEFVILPWDTNPSLSLPQWNPWDG